MAPDELLFPDLEPSMPFAGLTLAKIPVVNDALGGRMALVAGGSPSHVFEHGTAMRPYFFSGVGHGLGGPFGSDLAQLTLCEIEDGEIRTSFTRHVCASLITAFEPYGEEMLDCYVCMRPRHRRDLEPSEPSDFLSVPPTLRCREWCR